MMEAAMSRDISAEMTRTPKNSGKIRQVKKRIATLRRIDRMEHVERDFPGGRLLTNEEANRIQFQFITPPDEDTVQEMTQLGFRPRSAQIWQAPRTPKHLRRAYKLLDYILQQYKEPDFKGLPKLRAQKLANYLTAIQEVLETAESAGPITKQLSNPQSTRGKTQVAAPDLDTIQSRIREMPGTTLTINGLQTAKPVVWIGGDTKPYKSAILALGGRWSVKKSAWYINPKPRTP